MKMQAAVMRKVGGPVEVCEVELLPPKTGEVLVKMAATAVCHSDLNTLEDPASPTPQVLGHEGAATVVQVGEGVTTCKPGDRVALSWVPFCGSCAYCAAGQVHLCESAFGPMFAGTLLDGSCRLRLEGEVCYHSSLLSTFAEYAVVPQMSCIVMPEEMPLDKACMIGCGVATGYGAAVRAAGVRPGDGVAVFGIGGVGVNAVQAARLAGARTVIACDTKAENLALAKRFGATHTLAAGEGEDLPAAVAALTDGLGANSAIDCTGVPAVGTTAFRCVRKGGTVVVVGAYPAGESLSLPAGGFHRTGKVVRGSFYGDVNPFADFPAIARLYLKGRYNLDDLVIQKVKLADAGRVLESFHDPAARNTGRYIIEF